MFLLINVDFLAECHSCRFQKPASKSFCFLFLLFDTKKCFYRHQVLSYAAAIKDLQKAGYKDLTIARVLLRHKRCMCLVFFLYTFGSSIIRHRRIPFLLPLNIHDYSPQPGIHTLFSFSFGHRKLCMYIVVY